MKTRKRSARSLLLPPVLRSSPPHAAATSEQQARRPQHARRPRRRRPPRRPPRRRPRQARPPTTAAGAHRRPAAPTGGEHRRRRRGMKITYEINPNAVWDDGSPITVNDFQCTVRRHAEHHRHRCRPSATTRSPRSSRAPATTRSSSTLEVVYAPYKNLFSNPGPIKAAAFPNGCKDVSADMQSTRSRSPAVRTRWTRGAPTRSCSSPNDNVLGRRQGQDRRRSSWSRRPTPTPSWPR